jgi:hypothetical protein
MSRRGYDRHRRCAQEGCREVSITNYEYKRDYADAARRENGQPPWKCSRHAHPEEVLSVHNRETTATIVAGNKGQYSFLTWEGYWSGHCSGPGFKAWAEDFPAGTRLTITTRIDLPDGYTPPPPPEPPSRYATDAQDLDGGGVSG